MLQSLCILMLLFGGKETAKQTNFQEPPSVTHHEAVVDGKKINYKVTTGRMALKKEDGSHQASVFYMAYTRTKDAATKDRPLTFSFNGGPGSSSVWLHLGLLAPKRVAMDDEGNPLPPPYELIDNPYSMLDKTDMVFIDPVGTGYSRTAKDVKKSEFHGIREDIRSVGEFIQRYTTTFERWSSPKYLIGESYGTTRAAGLVDHLQQRYGMYFNGVILVSSILNFQTARFDVGNDLPYFLFLPTYTATAFYHGQLPDDLSTDLEKTLEEVEAFAMGEYAAALTMGDLLGDAQRDQVATKLARYTGLSKEYVLGTNLRINIHRFVKELLRDQRETVGRLDSRFKGIDRDAVGSSNEYDPSYSAILGPYSGTLNAYVRETLGYESELPYEILTGRVHPWSYKPYNNRYVNVAEDLRRAMTKNKDLKVFVANGYYDLATPYFATEYTFNHMFLDASLKDNITMAYYPSGHMMYIQLSSLQKMKRELDAFYADSL